MWNEAADALSWATVHQWIPAMYAEDILQQLDIGDGCATSWLWMLEAAQQKIPGMPCIENQHFLINVSAPHEEKPQVQGHPFKMRQLTESPGTVRQEMMTSIRLATVNVLTLYDIGKYGRGYISARQEAIMKQMKEEDLHIIGIQESRSTCDGYLHTDDFHVLSAPSTTKGSGGVQLWIRKVFNLSHRSMALHASDFKILHATSRRLTVRIEARWLKLIVVVGHAPASSGYEESFRFWQATTTSIPKKYHEWDTVYLCDANARIGSITTESVGGHGAEEENPSGSAFHQWMFEQELVVPQSFEAHHVGSHHTWTHARGPSARLDFIVLDKSLLSKEVTTWISDTIDVTTKRDDHQCVCVPQFRGKSGMQRLINRREVVIWQQSRQPLQKHLQCHGTAMYMITQCNCSNGYSLGSNQNRHPHARRVTCKMELGRLFNPRSFTGDAFAKSRLHNDVDGYVLSLKHGRNRRIPVIRQARLHG